MTRRTLLAQATGSVCLGIPPVEHFDKPSSLRPRRPISKLAGKERETFLRAYRELGCLPDSHPWSWQSHVKYHADHCGGAGSDVHKNWHFLSWHRYFVYFHERVLATLGQDSEFRLPYWDWDEVPAIPKDYLDSAGPLFRSRDSPVDQHIGIMVTQANLGKLLAARSFIGPEGLAGMAATPGTVAGAVPHSGIHTTISSEFGDALRAAREPLFYIHHANIDRYWEIWKKQPGVDISYPADWSSQQLMIGDQTCTAGAIVDPKTLGYSYESSSSAADFVSPPQILKVEPHDGELSFPLSTLLQLEKLMATGRLWWKSFPIAYLHLSGIPIDNYELRRVYSFALEAGAIKLPLGKIRPFERPTESGKIQTGFTAALNQASLSQLRLKNWAELLNVRLKLTYAPEGPNGLLPSRVTKFSSAALSLHYFRQG